VAFMVVGVRAPKRSLMLYLLEGSRPGEVGYLVRVFDTPPDEDTEFVTRAQHLLEKLFERVKAGWAFFELECDMVVDCDQLESVILLLLK